ncbi:MAG: DUF885 family protein, partial [Candidatus Binatia bacterium]
MSSFSDFCQGFFTRYFELNPTEAVYYGIEGYDHRLKDFSDESYREEKTFVRESLKELRQISPNEPDGDGAIDYALLEGRLAIDRYQHEKEDYRLKWPDYYLPTDAIYILTVRPTRDFSASLLSRLQRSPQMMQQGIANLSRPEANPPRLWTEMAIEAAKGGISFLASLPGHPKVQAEVKDTAALDKAIEQSKHSIKDFAGFLETDLLPRSR